MLKLSSLNWIRSSLINLKGLEIHLSTMLHPILVSGRAWVWARACAWAWVFVTIVSSEVLLSAFRNQSEMHIEWILHLQWNTLSLSFGFENLGSWRLFKTIGTKSLQISRLLPNSRSLIRLLRIWIKPSCRRRGLLPMRLGNSPKSGYHGQSQSQQSLRRKSHRNLLRKRQPVPAISRRRLSKS